MGTSRIAVCTLGPMSWARTKLALGQRHLKGYWSFPGGQQREMKTELGQHSVSTVLGQTRGGEIKKYKTTELQESWATRVQPMVSVLRKEDPVPSDCKNQWGLWLSETEGF